MATSGSTPRIRLTQLLYLLVLVLVALSDGRRMQGGWSLLAQSAGFVLVAAAVLWRLWTTLFIAGRKEERLVRDGPFARCRHPLYLGSIVGSAGIGLTSLSLIMTITLPVAIGVIAMLAARREDGALLVAHGDAWRKYRDAVPSFLPFGSASQTPETVSLPVRVYRKAFLDAASFLGLWLLVLLIENLRVSGAWPALFRLP